MAGRGWVAGVALVAAAATAVPAWSAPRTPAPTASVATYLQGEQLPVSAMTARWTDVHPGCSGRLDVGGETATGTTTVVTAVVTADFVSHPFVPHRAQVLSVGFERGRQSIA